jgi:hypothetical protein
MRRVKIALRTSTTLPMSVDQNFTWIQMIWRASLKKRINYVTFIGRCRTHPTSGVSSIKLSFCLEHTCHWASLVSGHQETWISPKKVSLYGRPLWMHTGNNSHGGKMRLEKILRCYSSGFAAADWKGREASLRNQAKENKPKAAAKARHVSAEELPRRRTSLAECRRSRDAQDVTLEPSDAGRVIIGNVAERNQTTTTVPAISLDWLPYIRRRRCWNAFPQSALL